MSGEIAVASGGGGQLPPGPGGAAAGAFAVCHVPVRYLGSLHTNCSGHMWCECRKGIDGLRGWRGCEALFSELPKGSLKLKVGRWGNLSPEQVDVPPRSLSVLPLLAM